MRNVTVSLAMGLIAVILGVATAWSTEAWVRGMEQGRKEVEQAKRELLSIPGLYEEHHKVFSNVGSRNWENRVKPEFLSAITRRTVRETGKRFPSVQDILDWARANPAEVREILRNLGDLP